MIKPLTPYIFAGIFLITILGLMQCSIVSNKKSSISLVIKDNLSFKVLRNSKKVQELPYLESSNLKVPMHQFELSKEWVKKLKLEELDERVQAIDTFSIKHILFNSKQFITLIISHQPNENETFINFVNYTKQGELINFIPIAYDEIVENCHTTNALVKPHQITVYKTDFCYASKTDTVHYNIDKNGEITPLTNLFKLQIT